MAEPLTIQVQTYGQFSRHIMEFEQDGISREIDRLKAQKKR